MLSAESPCGDVPTDDEMRDTTKLVETRCNQKLSANEVRFLRQLFPVHKTRSVQWSLSYPIFIKKFACNA